jgi:S1-C subfamily serine protease
MAVLVVPIATPTQVLGSGFVAAWKPDKLVVVTCLHILGDKSSNVGIVIPPNGGDCSRVQLYPISGSLPLLNARVVMVDPSTDLVFLVADWKERIDSPMFIDSPDDVHVGDEVVVITYPFAGDVGGYFLATWTPCHITALGRRDFVPNIGVREQILTYQAHPGSSGGPVVRRSDGRICGVLRGNLAPPASILIGGVAVGADSSVTFATSAEVIPQIIEHIFQD